MAIPGYDLRFSRGYTRERCRRTYLFKNIFVVELLFNNVFDTIYT